MSLRDLTIDITLSAKSKAYRYYSVPVLRERVRDQRGTLFQRGDAEYLLRTNRADQTIVIIFEYEPAAGQLVVIGQTSDHYDWGDLDHIQNPPFDQ